MRKLLLICLICLLSVEIGLAATGAVTGRVTDISNGGSIIGASVKVGGFSATTNSSGYYTVSGLAAGSYTVTASHSGYFAESVTTSVKAGATSTANAQLPTGGKVATAKTLTTNSSGGYNTSWVPVGTYTVTVSAAGYSTQSKTTTVYTGITTTLNVSVAASTTTSTSVTGRVTNISTGNSISGAKVSLGANITYADSSGIYRFSNLAAGTYSVTAVASGYCSLSKPVTATSGTTSTLNFQLATGGIITGTVTTSSGALLPGATVVLSGGKIATTVTRTTNSSGYYSSSWVPVGTYTVTVSDAGYTTQSKSASAYTGATTTVNVVLAPSASSVAHQTTVQWSASASTVAGYNVYRSTFSGGPYMRMNASTNPYTSYADPTVSAGQTYYYVVTSVGTNGLEGGYSSQVKAVIPTP